MQYWRDEKSIDETTNRIREEFRLNFVKYLIADSFADIFLTLEQNFNNVSVIPKSKFFKLRVERMIITVQNFKISKFQNFKISSNLQIIKFRDIPNSKIYKNECQSVFYEILIGDVKKLENFDLWSSYRTFFENFCFY